MAVLAAGLLLAAAIAVLTSTGGSTAVATHTPADKVVATGSKVLVTEPGEAAVLSSGILRSSAPSDLLISVTAECSIATDVTTSGNDDQEASGVVEVWTEIDGDRVGINSVPTSTTSAESQDDGEVVFCNQAHRRQTSFGLDDDADTIRTFDQTKQANGFNWVALNVGKGTHEVVVKARLTETATNENTADAAIGNRTLVIEPAKLANDAGV